MVHTRVRLWAILALSTSMAGCSSDGGEGCLAVGWASTVSIELTGGTGDVEAIELLCDGSPCRDGAVVRLKDPWLKSPNNSTPVPPAGVTDAKVTQVDGDTWTTSFMFDVPDRATVRALASNGEVLAERDVIFEWKRVGGSELCGGPREAEPITLEIRS